MCRYYFDGEGEETTLIAARELVFTKGVKTTYYIKGMVVGDVTMVLTSCNEKKEEEILLIKSSKYFSLIESLLGVIKIQNNYIISFINTPKTHKNNLFCASEAVFSFRPQQVLAFMRFS